MVDEPFRCRHFYDSSAELQMIECAVGELLSEFEIEVEQGSELSLLVVPHLVAFLSSEPVADDCSAELL